MYKVIPEGKQPCFIFGNEGDGIQRYPRSRKKISGSITICIRQLGALQSLNVSAAAAIILGNYKSWKAGKRLEYLI